MAGSLESTAYKKREKNISKEEWHGGKKTRACPTIGRNRCTRGTDSANAVRAKKKGTEKGRKSKNGENSRKDKHETQPVEQNTAIASPWLSTQAPAPGVKLPGD